MVKRDDQAQNKTEQRQLNLQGSTVCLFDAKCFTTSFVVGGCHDQMCYQVQPRTGCVLFAGYNLFHLVMLKRH